MKKILLGLLIGVVGLVTVFLSPAFLKPVINHETKVTINRPIEEVWEKFSDSGNMGKWMDGFKSIETISGEPDTAGSKFRIVIEKDGQRFEAIETVKEYVAKERIVFDLDSDILINNVVIKLVNRGLTTDISQSETITGKGVLYRAIFYWLQSTMKDQSKTNLNNLKKFIEAG